MKNLTEILSEHVINEAATQWNTKTPGAALTKGVDSLNCDYKGNKKYGFLSWLPNEETVCLTAADSAEDFAEAFDTEVEYCEDMFKLKVGESANINKMGAQYTMRIW